MFQTVIFVTLLLFALNDNVNSNDNYLEIDDKNRQNLDEDEEMLQFSLEDFLGDDRTSKFLGRSPIHSSTPIDQASLTFDAPPKASVDPEIDLNAEGIVKRWGYPSERHVVKTEDGFYLTVFRIPHGRKNATRRAASTVRPAVFLQHGLLCSSTNWITNLPNQSLAFILADAGFDVWMGNMRGNTYSRTHSSLPPSSAKFWAFSWDEMAKFDLPAMIDLVVKVTKQPKIFYVGHSQGTLTMFAASSRSATLSSRIRHFFALGPVATVGHLDSMPIRILATFQNLVEDLFRIFGVREFMPNQEIFDWLAWGLCRWETRIYCSDLLFVLCGYDPAQLNATRLPVYISHTPAGTSVQNMIHFAQMVRSNKFQMFDYGSSHDNLLRYNQSTPPLYDISAVNLPTSLYWGGKDLMADPRDVKEQIVDKMRTIVDDVFLAQWDHLDFIWGLDAANLIYHDMVEKMKKILLSD